MTQEPKWEMTEHGWHGVALLTGGIQWHAFVEHVDAPQHLTWAGTTFESLSDAQDWCRAEIALLRRQHGPGGPGATPPPLTTPPQLDAWGWLWDTLSRELGELRTTEVRDEFARRRREEKLQNS
ncbi:MAG: hypothetical protein ACLFVO_04305 [Chloroflexaceae bacterium]